MQNLTENIWLLVGLNNPDLIPVVILFPPKKYKSSFIWWFSDWKWKRMHINAVSGHHESNQTF